MSFKLFNRVRLRFHFPWNVRPNQAFIQVCTDFDRTPLKLRFSLLIWCFGVHFNVPYIAERWGEIEPACGNGYIYHGWLGRHYSI